MRNPGLTPSRKPVPKVSLPTLRRHAVEVRRIARQVPQQLALADKDEGALISVLVERQLIREAELDQSIAEKTTD